jgi:hypothetical protein
LNRLSQSRTVSPSRPTSRAMAGTRQPWLASQMILARSTARAAAVREWASCRTVSSSSAVSERTWSAMGKPAGCASSIIPVHLRDGPLRANLAPILPARQARPRPARDGISSLRPERIHG